MALVGPAPGVVDRIEEVVAAGQSATAPASFVSSWAKRSCHWRCQNLEELDGKVRVFRLNDGQHEIGYAFREVIDLMALGRA
jgi:two-component system chemotaxis sensor kinase CheA